MSENSEILDFVCSSRRVVRCPKCGEFDSASLEAEIAFEAAECNHGEEAWVNEAEAVAFAFAHARVCGCAD